VSVQSVAEIDPNSTDLRALVQRLSLEQRVRLLTGSGTWTIHAAPEVGLRVITVSDGPIGVRGIDTDLRPSAQLPAPSATAATWDAELLARLGALVASEANRKGVDVVLAPVVNLQRSPVGGRHFECFSEDPFLTARMAVPFVAAIQAHGVGACVKHFIGNETETDRTEYLARIDERTLREVYLAPFEAVVREAGVWSIMAAYNGISTEGLDAPATSHGPLVDGILKKEWGFDGVVMSDWLATKDTVEPANGGLDLVMPGPGGPWEERLLDAVTAGYVSVDTIDDKVERLLRLATRVGALSGTEGVVDSFLERAGNPEPDEPHVSALLRETAARSTIVLRNADDLLPVEPSAIRRLALIGANAVKPFVQGGGSASVLAPHLSEPLKALRAVMPEALISLHRGGATEFNAPVFADDVIYTRDGERGLDVEILDKTGTVIERRVIESARAIWLRDLPAGAANVRFLVAVALSEPGVHGIEIAPVGAHRTLVNGRLISKSIDVVGSEVVLDSSYSNPQAWSADVDGGPDVFAMLDVTVQVVDADAMGRFARLHLRHRPPQVGSEREIEDAVEAARNADVAVVIVGTNEETESEGWDRPSLSLPGRQDELVRRVAAANPKTIVVVNAGAPVLLPWLDEVSAVLWWWLPGQEAGASLADVIVGNTEPSGRLPWTLPAAEADVPVPDGIPVDGYIDYAEGVHVGYRGWDLRGLAPAREFGFGLGYGQWHYGDLSVDGDPADDSVYAHVAITNIGLRASREIVQVYLEAPADDGLRPMRWLAGFAVADVAAGDTQSVDIHIPRRAFETWDVDAGSWALPTGRYVLRAGRSSRDLLTAKGFVVEEVALVGS
jgi:beta-glucosidase